MSTFFQLDDGRLRALESAIASSIPLDVLERGFDYYRREKVLSVQVMEGFSIYGVVKGTAIYAVTLDSDDFAFSTCTCPVKGNCKHMAAVFFAYQAFIGASPDEVYNRLLNGIPFEPSAGAKTNAEDSGLIEHHPGNWLDEMEEKHGEVWKQCRHSLHPLQSVLTSIKAASKNWDAGLRRLHWMHGIVFVLEQAERAYSHTDSYSRYYYEMAFARMTEPWVNQYQELAAELDPAALNAEERAAVESLIGVFHRRDMDREQQLHRWETLYFALWANLIADAEWAAREEKLLRGRLRQMKAEHGIFFLPMALAYLAFADDRDEDAMALLSRTVFSRTALLACDCALQRLEERDWTKLEDWIGYLYEGLSIERKSKAFGPFLSMCRLADRQQPDNPRWQRYLVSFLPYSYSALTEHWLDLRQYTKWADLQLLFGIEPDEIDVQLMREIGKAAPRVLYPLYHQAIDGAIRSRNRQGYKQAVKLMKRLEKLYKAEKQHEAWSRFVDGIVRKHQRLRALQEELWRGKIVT
ncbi:SWIM zinc finger family protein [Paenibacillus rhizovicinus]|uniref:SWIM zinc finger family protein n=1 Tax=Paenibacillus rhizovicinus TaxID=2704463 RepID=A0A6C0P733_9BACL|nr:SWIM zinc finger family protein [Paenibacillus rhizovicinus]QHW33513.1 SWIM zinc finger family protein [Paenibacillus rhizovicinus]